jgi:hypothetical protein
VSVGGKNRPRAASVLAGLLVLNLVLVILLSPLGFENRPQAALKIGGYIAIGTIFAGFLLDLASVILALGSKVSLASRLAIVGSILLFVPVVGDRIGAFFSVPIPPVINALEYVLTVVLLVTLFVAWRVYTESDRLAA